MKPLTVQQQRTVDTLIEGRRLERVVVDHHRASVFLTKAMHRLSEVSKLSWAEGRYNFAYDAAHDVGEALLAAYGLRTTNGPGQHEAIGRFLGAVMTDPPGNAGAKRFDRMRRTRNQQRYDIRVVGDSDADLAVQAARSLYDGALAQGIVVFG